MGLLLFSRRAEKQRARSSAISHFEKGVNLIMSARKIRRAEAHLARKLARKAGFPAPSPEPAAVPVEPSSPNRVSHFPRSPPLPLLPPALNPHQTLKIIRLPQPPATTAPS